MKNPLDVVNRSLDIVEVKISELEGITIEPIQNETFRRKEKTKKLR